jgi:hypothetical protein
VTQWLPFCTGESSSTIISCSNRWLTLETSSIMTQSGTWSTRMYNRKACFRIGPFAFCLPIWIESFGISSHYYCQILAAPWSARRLLCPTWVAMQPHGTLQWADKFWLWKWRPMPKSSTPIGPWSYSSMGWWVCLTTEYMEANLPEAIMYQYHENLAVNTWTVKSHLHAASRKVHFLVWIGVEWFVFNSTANLMK